MGYAKRASAAAQTAREKPAAAPRPAAVKPRKGAGSVWSAKIGPAKEPSMNKTEVLLFTSELADLIEAGMTLGQALGALSSQGAEDSGQRAVCADLRERIERGENFSDACRHHGKTFEPIYFNMIRAAEASGAMVDVLRRLTDHYERYEDMRGKIKSAMSYPVIVLVFGVAAVVGALVWIIPKFQKVFAALGATLPLPTRILIGMSDFVIDYGWILLACIIAGTLWFRKWKNTPSGRLKIDGWKLRAPLIKGIVACGAYSSLAYTLKTLLQNGVNVLQALKISEETCGNAVIAQALATARKRVTDGTTISGPLASSGAFPRMMTDMLGVGEQAGDMTGSLEHIGKRYRKDMDRNIAAFTNALEPIMIVLIAAVIGFVAVSILMAVFQVSGSLG